MLKPVADWDLPSLATALTAASLKAKLQSMRTGARCAGERDPTSARWRGRRRDFLSVMVAVNGGEGDRTTALNQHASLRHCRLRHCHQHKRRLVVLVSKRAHTYQARMAMRTLESSPCTLERNLQGEFSSFKAVLARTTDLAGGNEAAKDEGAGVAADADAAGDAEDNAKWEKRAMQRGAMRGESTERRGASEICVPNAATLVLHLRRRCLEATGVTV